MIVALQPAPGNPHFQTAVMSTPAEGRILLIALGAGKRDVAPFAANPIGTLNELLIDDQAASAPRSKHDRKGDFRPCGGAVDGFRERQAVRIICNSNRPF